MTAGSARHRFGSGRHRTGLRCRGTPPAPTSRLGSSDGRAHPILLEDGEGTPPPPSLRAARASVGAHSSGGTAGGVDGGRRQLGFECALESPRNGNAERTGRGREVIELMLRHSRPDMEEKSDAPTYVFQ